MKLELPQIIIIKLFFVNFDRWLKIKDLYKIQHTDRDASVMLQT